MVMEVVLVKFRDHDVGAVSYNTETRLGFFEYAPKFIRTGIELSPITMPLSDKIYSFPEADPATFKGLPGMIADSLPDDFGNAVMNGWIASQGKSVSDISPLQRLQYTGNRGMGALSYSPAIRKKGLNASQSLDISSLVSIAQSILNKRKQFSISLPPEGQENQKAMMALLSVGMCAGGARAKAVLAFNDDFTKVRSGQTNAPKGFTHYLMKFDGVSEHNTNEETFGDPTGYGTMEYVYYLMAKNCGIEMMPCHLLDEGSRRHFITKRFDRVGNTKIHVQTLNGLAHISFKQAGAYSYAELFAVARQLNLGAEEAMQLFKRMVFNVVARNHDDHSKNFGFMLGDDNRWQLSPAYDLAYSYKPGSPWVNSHCMQLNGKRDNFVRVVFFCFVSLCPLFKIKKKPRCIDETVEYVSQWKQRAKEHGVPPPPHHTNREQFTTKNINLQLNSCRG